MSEHFSRIGGENHSHVTPLKFGRLFYLRIVPNHEDLGNPFEMGLVLWGG